MLSVLLFRGRHYKYNKNFNDAILFLQKKSFINTTIVFLTN